MCELTDILETDCYELGIMTGCVEKIESVAEINGKDRNISVLRNGETITHFLSHPHLHAVYTRSITRQQVGPKVLLGYDSGGRVSGKIEISWGGKDGTTVSGGVEAEVHDDEGNYASVKVEQNSNGEGKAEISAGHEEE